MSEKPQEKSPGETVAEIKAMVTDYAKQEVQGPLDALKTWTIWGIVGAILLAIGIAYLGFGLLRLLQSVDALDDNASMSPFLLSALALLAVAGLAGRAAARKFGDD